MYEARQKKEKVSRRIDGGSIRQKIKDNRVLQKVVIEERQGTNRYTNAKKIISKDNTAWWQFFIDSSGYVKDDFVVNEISEGNYVGDRINSNEYGESPVKQKIDLEDCNNRGHFVSKGGKLLPFSQASDTTLFSAADQKAQINRAGTTWHHGKTPYLLFLLDTAIHSAFKHKGWASTHGSRNEMKDFIVPDNKVI